MLEFQEYMFVFLKQKYTLCGVDNFTHTPPFYIKLLAFYLIPRSGRLLHNFLESLSGSDCMYVYYIAACK